MPPKWPVLDTDTDQQGTWVNCIWNIGSILEGFLVSHAPSGSPDPEAGLPKDLDLAIQAERGR